MNEEKRKWTQIFEMFFNSFKGSSSSSTETRHGGPTVVTTTKSNFVVSQSDLWDTNMLSHTKQHGRQSPRGFGGGQRCSEHGHLVSVSSAYDHPISSPIQRSVSEKNRAKHRHKATTIPLSPSPSSKGIQASCLSETDSERDEFRPITVTSAATAASSTANNNGKVNNNQCLAQQRKSMANYHRANNIGGIISATISGHTVPHTVTPTTTIHHAAHHHSSPNVAPSGTGLRIATSKYSGNGGVTGHKSKADCTSSSMYGASSETELMDGETAILPIFRKLLTEKSPNYRGRSAVGQSCPNISIKCDIVEYL